MRVKTNLPGKVLDKIVDAASALTDAEVQELRRGRKRPVPLVKKLSQKFGGGRPGGLVRRLSERAMKTIKSVGGVGVGVGGTNPNKRKNSISSAGPKRRDSKQLDPHSAPARLVGSRKPSIDSRGGLEDVANVGQQQHQKHGKEASATASASAAEALTGEFASNHADIMREHGHLLINDERKVRKVFVVFPSFFLSFFQSFILSNVSLCFLLNLTLLLF